MYLAIELLAVYYFTRSIKIKIIKKKDFNREYICIYVHIYIERETYICKTLKRTLKLSIN